MVFLCRRGIDSLQLHPKKQCRAIFFKMHPAFFLSSDSKIKKNIRIFAAVFKYKEK